MSDVDKARAQYDARRNAARRQTAGSVHAERALQRYLGAKLYEAQHTHTTHEQDTDRSADEPEEPED